MPARQPTTLTAFPESPTAREFSGPQQVLRQRTVVATALTSFLRAAAPLNVRARRTLVVDGELPQRAFLMLAGRAVLTVNADNRHDFIADQYVQGDLFGTEALAGFPAVGNVTTAEASTLKTMELIALERLMLDEPELALWVARTLVRRLCVASQRCAELAYGSLERRILAALERIAEDFGAPHYMGWVIDRPLRSQEIASLVGASRSRVSTALQELLRSGQVVREGSRLVLTSRSIANRLAVR